MYCTLDSPILEIAVKHPIRLHCWKNQPGLLGFFLLGVNHNVEKNSIVYQILCYNDTYEYIITFSIQIRKH